MAPIDEDVEVTIRISRAAYGRAWEIVTERDPDMLRRYGVDKGMTVEDYLALLIEQKLK